MTSKCRAFVGPDLTGAALQGAECLEEGERGTAGLPSCVFSQPETRHSGPMLRTLLLVEDGVGGLQGPGFLRSCSRSLA